jgi:thioredoxin-like negative regulator of GroEL
MASAGIFFRLLFPWLLLSALLSSCATGPVVEELIIPLSAAPPGERSAPERPAGNGVADEIRSLVESGVPSSLHKALDLIKRRGLENGDYGRVMAAVSVTLLRKLYPDNRASLPPADPPRLHPYTRILNEAEQGRYAAPPRNSFDYLELTLPFLALLDETREDRLLAALPDLKRARDLNPRGMLAAYCIGLVHEKTGQWEKAASEYRKVYDASREFYPAALGLARYLNFRGESEAEIALLSDMAIQYPDNMAIKRQLALVYYDKQDWSRAEPAIAEALRQDSRDGQFILMQARLLVEQGRFNQAQAPLDLYALINPNDRLYLFLRARLQAEGYRNRDGALNYLRSLLKTYPDDNEALVYAAQLLMESKRSEDQAEGREILTRLIAAGESSLPASALAAQDAVYRQAWEEARPHVDRLLEERRSPQDLLLAYTVERGLGNRAAALAYAQELYQTDSAGEEGAIAYISSLIEIGRRSEAAALLETRLAGAKGGFLKSRYYYLRSLLRPGEEASMNDLHSSLFEDPRNLDALTAMFTIYHRRRDERRALYYLKQALAIAPEDPQLKRYETEYERATGN